MIYIKVDNLIQLNGNADYKGLDIDGILAGTQIYLLENGKNEAYFTYNGDIVGHDDIQQITEEEYLAVKYDYEKSLSVAVNPEEEIQQLRLAMAEMAEAHEQEKTEMQLALAELAELVGGEANHG